MGIFKNLPESQGGTGKKQPAPESQCPKCGFIGCLCDKLDQQPQIKCLGCGEMFTPIVSDLGYARWCEKCQESDQQPQTAEKYLQNDYPYPLNKAYGCGENQFPELHTIFKAGQKNCNCQQRYKKLVEACRELKPNLLNIVRVREKILEALEELKNKT